MEFGEDGWREQKEEEDDMIAVLCTLVLSLHFGLGWWTLLTVILMFDLVTAPFRVLK